MSGPVAVNRLPIVLAVVTLAVVTVLGVSQCSKPAAITSAAAPVAEVAPPAVPVRPSDADGPDATIRTLTARLAEADAAKNEADQQATRIKELEDTLAKQETDPRFSEMTAQLANIATQNEALQQRLLEIEVANASNGPAQDNMADFGIAPGQAPGTVELDGSYPTIDLGQAALAGQAALTGQATAQQSQSGYTWVRPLSAAPLQQTADGTALAATSAPEITIQSVENVPDVVDIDNVTLVGEVPAPLVKQAITPRFTLPVNATLLDNVAMTAFIGRIPINGVVNDGYRFKILASADGLATNGFKLPPDIKQMVFSGEASGDWSLSCVRGIIDSATFTYEDGSVQTYGGEIATRQGSARNQTKQNLGYISDQAGVPCIKGDRVTNAPKVLTGRFIASAFEAAARGFAEGQTQSVVTQTGAVVRTIDDAAQFGAFTGLAGGATDAKQYLDSRLGQIFDAVYAPPGQKVAIHIEAQINLDHDIGARKLSYDDVSPNAYQLD